MRVLFPYVGTALLGFGAYWGMTIAAQTPAQSPMQLPATNGSSTTQPDTQSSTSVSLPRLRPAIYYEAITDRPLFAPDRRPFTPVIILPTPTPVEPTPEPIPDLPPELVLMGTMGTTQNPIALIEHDGASAEWAAVGDDFEGWALSEIGPDWIVISDGTTEIRLDMFQ